MLKKKKLLFSPVLGMPGGGEGSQQLDPMPQFLLRDGMSPRQPLELLYPPMVFLRDRSLGEEVPAPGSVFPQHIEVAVPGCLEASRAPPWPQCMGHTVRSGEQNHTLSHSFCLNNNLSFLPSWAGCLVMNVDREDNKEFGH